MSAAEIKERQKIAHTMRIAGLSWSEVAAWEHNGGPLYADASGAWRGAKAYRDSMDHGDDLMEQRAVDMHRFDALQRAMWRKALGGDLPAAKFVLAVMTAREKLLGAQGLTPRETAHDPLDELAQKRAAS